MLDTSFKNTLITTTVKNKLKSEKITFYTKKILNLRNNVEK